jgi:hypothetical protein
MLTRKTVSSNIDARLASMMRPVAPRSTIRATASSAERMRSWGAASGERGRGEGARGEGWERTATVHPSEYS